MTIPNETLAAIEEAGKLATPRPWGPDPCSCSKVIAICTDVGERHICTFEDREDDTERFREADAEYSWLAGNNADTLAAELRDLRAKMERVKAILGKPRSWIERDPTARIIVHNTEARELAELLNH